MIYHDQNPSIFSDVPAFGQVFLRAQVDCCESWQTLAIARGQSQAGSLRHVSFQLADSYLAFMALHLPLVAIDSSISTKANDTNLPNHFRNRVCNPEQRTTAFADTYYVSPSGSDTNTGTSETESFQMVQHGIDKMKAGDTLVVLDGFYTGTLKLKSGITVRAKNPRKVIFSGAEPLQGTFQRHSENIYKIDVGKLPKQVFYKNQPMTWARWPNMKWSENWNRGKKWAGGSAGFGTLKHKAFAQLKDLDLTGGYCFLRYAKGNSCYSREIKGFDGGTLLWDDTNFYNRLFTGEDGKRGRMAIAGGAKGVRGTFFLAGALDLLDSEGEWFAKDGTLYFYAPGGQKPKAADFLIKTNDYSIYEIEALSDVQIEGVDFLATSIKLANPNNQKISFRNVYFSYIGAEHLFVDTPKGKKNSKPIDLAGSQISFENCLFAGAHNSALNLSGTLLSVRNCVFTETNRHGNFQSVPLFISAKGPFQVTKNTFFNNCSDAIRVGFKDGYEKSVDPDMSYNNICNAGIYNTDVSGAYFPKMTQHYTQFHHNWVHNVKGNGVRLDQAGEEFTVHHNVFWSSKRGMSIEGYGKFNVYNNTSFRNKETCDLIRNVVAKAKGSNPKMVSNDTSFPPIEDWNVLNNLVQKFADGVGPSEKGPFTKSKTKGTLNPERDKSKSLPVKDRGNVQGNITKFNPKIFENENLSGLNLVPDDKIVEGGVTATKEMIAEGVKSLDTFRGAYDYRAKPWSAGSNWMPYDMDVPKTMAQSQQFAKKHGSISVVPAIKISGLSVGLLSRTTYKPVPKVEDTQRKPKKKKKKKKKKAKPQP